MRKADCIRFGTDTLERNTHPGFIERIINNQFQSLRSIDYSHTINCESPVNGSALVGMGMLIQFVCNVVIE